MPMKGSGQARAASTRGRGRPRDNRVDSAVADAVAELLAEVGYEGLTIEGVASRAGVAKTTVYRRGLTKPRLVAQALDLQSHEQGTASDTGSLQGDLLAQVEAVTHAFATPIGQAIVGLVPAARHHPELAEALRNGFIAARQVELSEMLARAVERGELGPGIDEDVVIDLIISPVWYRALVWGESPGPERLAALVKIVVMALTASDPG